QQQQQQQQQQQKEATATNLPAGDTFLLLKYLKQKNSKSENEQKTISESTYQHVRKIFKEAKETRSLRWPDYRPELFVYFVGALFNDFYAVGSTNCYNIVSSFVSRAVSMMHDHLPQHYSQRAQERVKYLLNQLVVSDSDYKFFKNQPSSTARPNTKTAIRIQKQHMEILRLGWHLVGVVLSLPVSPLSILFHNPNQYRNAYLLGMPEDQSTVLLKAMSGRVAWSCRNNHLYFVPNGVTQKCPTCGPNTEGKSKWRLFSSAESKRVGVVDEDGHIIPEDLEAADKIPKMAPQGYVITEGVDDICRMFDEVSVRVARLFVNLILLIHHSCYKTSDVKQFLQKNNFFFFFSDLKTLIIIIIIKKKKKRFTKLKGENAVVMKKLLQMTESYINKIAAAVGHLSIESCVLLLHRIVHEYYLTYEEVYLGGLDDLSIVGREDFENYLIQSCIGPVLGNHENVIRETRNWTLLDPVCSYWSKRVEEDINMNSEEGKIFVEKYRPDLFLPYRIVTLSEFRTFVLQNNENITRFPVILGLLTTMATSSGYSIFALQYLPEMINWIKLIHSRFNRRLSKEDAESRQQEFTAQYALTKCAEEKWGEVKQWEKALQGFVQGWNHVVSRLTTDKSKKGAVIQEGSGENHNANSDQKSDGLLIIPDMDSPSSPPVTTLLPLRKTTERRKFSRWNPVGLLRSIMTTKDVKETLGDVSDDEQVNTTEQGTTKSGEEGEMVGWMKRYLVIIDQINPSENVPFECIKGSDPNGKITPKDVPLLWALECGVDGPLATSKMLRLLLDHLVTVNNSLLANCHQQALTVGSSDNDPKSAIGEITLTKISNERDVVGIDEQNFLQMVQHCTAQKLRYGENVPLDINLQLLETQLKETFIIGRKFLKFDLRDVFFELSGEYDMDELFDSIEQNFRGNALQGGGYFVDAEETVLCRLKERITQDTNISYEDFQQHSAMEATPVPNVDKAKAFKTAKQAIEQVLISLQRQKVTHGPNVLIGTYMSQDLHLPKADYVPFIKTEELLLKHSKNVWEYLNRIHLAEENQWHMMPLKLLELYKQLTTGFNTDSMWKLLFQWKRLLEKLLSEQELKEPSKIALSTFLKGAISDPKVEKLIEGFPKDLSLCNAGPAFEEFATVLFQNLFSFCDVYHCYYYKIKKFN
ncbi:hypothetical protein RFI_20299, partial [Reticulomyxa filosa]